MRGEECIWEGKIDSKGRYYAIDGSVASGGPYQHSSDF